MGRYTQWLEHKQTSQQLREHITEILSQRQQLLDMGVKADAPFPDPQANPVLQALMVYHQQRQSESEASSFAPAPTVEHEKTAEPTNPETLVPTQDEPQPEEADASESSVPNFQILPAGTPEAEPLPFPAQAGETLRDTLSPDHLSQIEAPSATDSLGLTSKELAQSEEKETSLPLFTELTTDLSDGLESPWWAAEVAKVISARDAQPSTIEEKKPLLPTEIRDTVSASNWSVPGLTPSGGEVPGNVVTAFGVPLNDQYPPAFAAFGILPKEAAESTAESEVFQPFGVGSASPASQTDPPKLPESGTPSDMAAQKKNEAVSPEQVKSPDALEGVAPPITNPVQAIGGSQQESGMERGIKENQAIPGKEKKRTLRDLLPLILVLLFLVFLVGLGVVLYFNHLLPYAR